MISAHFRDKPFSIAVIQVCALTTNSEEAGVEWFYDDVQDLLENTKKRRSFHHRGLECKSRKSRDTWSNRPVSPWSTKWSTEKGNIVLPRECTGRSNTLFQQHERRLYTWTSPDGQYRNQTDYFFAAEDREALYTGSWLWFRSWTPYCQI